MGDCNIVCAMEYTNFNDDDMQAYTENKGNAMRVRDSALPVGAIQGTFACSALTGLLLIICSAIAWDSDKIGSECTWINSKQEHINYDGCPDGYGVCQNPVATIVLPTCPKNRPDQQAFTCVNSCHEGGGPVPDMKTCLSEICSKDEEI